MIFRYIVVRLRACAPIEMKYASESEMPETATDITVIRPNRLHSALGSECVCVAL